MIAQPKGLQPAPDRVTITKDMHILPDGTIYHSKFSDSAPIRISFDLIDGLVDPASVRVGMRP